MKNNRLIATITMMSTAFALAISGIIIHKNVAPIEVEATQHSNNYDEYTYSGNYYDDFIFSSTRGMNGKLRQDLTSLIFPDDWYTYSGSSSGTLGLILQSSDQDPTNPSNMVMFYSRDSVTKRAAGGSTTDWNREHVWPQDLSNNHWGTSKAGADLLHIRPTWYTTNNKRGNLVYGNVGNTGALTYNDMLYAHSNGSLFEPIDSVKGDVARILMYIWTAYTDYYNDSNLKVTKAIESYNTLLQWHTMDKPDALEGLRNNYSESSNQHNRNPFVDHPELAWMIFAENNNLVSSSVKEACQQAYPASGSGTNPVTPTGISISQSSLSLEVGGSKTLTATLSPTNATGTITWSSSNENIATINQSGKVTAVSSGTATITASVQGVSGVSATCLVTVSESAINEEVTYNLKNCGETSNYTSSSDITFDDGKIWNIPGNQTLSYGLKLGGKLSSATDRAMYSKSSYNNVSSIVITHGGKDSVITVNSVKLYVYDSADKAAAGNPSAADEVVVGTFVNNGTTTFEPASGNPWQNKYFRIVYNVSSSDSGSNKGVVLTELKIVYAVNQQSTETVEDYLSTASTYATLHGRETGTTSTSFDFSKQSYSNEQIITTVPVNDSNISVVCNDNEQTNVPKYFTSGTALRIYTGNSITFAAKSGSNAKIVRIEFTFATGSGSGNYPSALSTTTNTYSNGVWNGDASSIEFTLSAQSRIVSFVVTYYTGTYSVDNVSIRFGASISKANWNAIHQANEDWVIEDYGVMMLKKATLQGYGKATVEEAYKANKNVNIIRKVKDQTTSYADPYELNGVYSFTARLSFSTESQYDDLIVASPFVVVSGEYYFLGEEDLEFSVNTLASKYKSEPTYHGGSSLSNKALTYLSTAH